MLNKQIFSYSRKEIIYLIAFFVSYLVMARFSVHFFRYSNTYPALIWPPAGIAMAGMILGGYKMWPSIAIAAFFSSFLNNAPTSGIVAAVIGNTAQPLAGAYLLKTLNFHPSLTRLRHVFSLMGVSMVATMIVPTVVLIIQRLVGVNNSIATSWSNIWVGEILSVLILTPFIVSWVYNWKIELRGRRVVELICAFALLGAIVYPLFWTRHSLVGGIPLVYLFLVPLFWIGLRFGARKMTLAIFITAIVSISGALLGKTASVQPLGTRLFNTEIFIEIIAGMFFIVTAIVQERGEVTEILKDHVNQLQDALIEIHSQDEAKSEFLAVLAHELRNPLAPVLSTLELLKMENTLGEEETKLLIGAENQVHLMKRLLDDLLDISRISKKTFKLQKKDVELNKIISNSLNSVTELKNQGHQIELSLPKNSLWINVDPVRMEQIVVNLLNNAAKYTNPGGQIKLACVHSDRGLVISVTDNGIGIRRDMLDNIFEPFLQAAGGKSSGSGLGVGLALTKKLVEMHGATIRAYSEGPGRGSQFIINFPPTVLAKAPSVAVEVEEEVLPASKFKILVVDDNEDAAKGLTKLLQFRGHRVTTVFTGRDAVSIAPLVKPDVVFLDIGLPDISGYEVIASLNKMPAPGVPVALTGYGQAEDKRRAKEAGFSYHLTKPVEFSQIESILSNVQKV